ncbi:SDR family NAD(P)-dependent oxidoreductase [Microbacterium yannicii]|uniref:SDR family NAD(P)-dependent oxidoreductase n=1 Tax=Microbacterium yannicii TaxID=671622 RepID=UPI0002D7A306|nr:SDR family oxidoreductase [Microbacterium yannicii]
MTEFSGLAAVVTGGASGIGAAIVTELTDRGCRVAVLDREPAEPSRGVVSVRVDVSDDPSVRAGVAEAAEQIGGIDIVVNCAGISATGDVTANGDDEWHRVLDVNVVGIARVTRAALPWLRRSPHPAVVNIASVVAHVGVVDRVLYGASKGAVAAMTLAMAADHVREGIRVNAVSPGTADTPWVERLLQNAADPAAAAEALRARQPMGRLVSAAEVAYAVASLASPRAGATTGTLLSVDGGMARVRA